MSSVDPVVENHDGREIRSKNVGHIHWPGSNWILMMRI